MKKLIKLITGIILILFFSCFCYYSFGYEGPTEEYTIMTGKISLVLDGHGNYTLVMEKEIMVSPPFLAIWFGKVKEVRKWVAKNKFKKAYVWRRSLSKDWNEDFSK